MDNLPLTQKQIEQIYSGFLGLNIGIRLGAPLEPEFWTYERIKNVYGDIKTYTKDYKHFAADDDSNGPVLFLRALDDNGIKEPSPQNVAEAWLNYAREGVGLYWWGGYGKSTEHTAYINLKNGIEAPLSGSCKVNGKTIAEQIGGQIFIDTWGLICPNNPKKAAQYARTAASVSHDGEGLNGAMFMAACIADAFENKNPEHWLKTGLSFIPEDSLYYAVAMAVWNFYKNNPDNWHACRLMLEEYWGYDKYPGNCHIIPNAGACVLALLYGKGDFSKSIEIATMCAWDTDCNASNVGTILGVACGLEGIPSHYRKPINDEIVLSGISGYLNILDIPSYVKHLAYLANKLKGLDVEKDYTEGEINFDFELPGSTHGLRFECDNPYFEMECEAKPTIIINEAYENMGAKLYYKPFYRRDDFSDDRYMPVFSPTIYPNTEAIFNISYEKYKGDRLLVRPYVKETFSKQILFGDALIISQSSENIDIKMTMPNTNGGIIDEVGLYIDSLSYRNIADFGKIKINSFKAFGKADYIIDISKSQREFDSILPFSHNLGAWELIDGKMQGLCVDYCEAYTGNYFSKDIKIEGKIIPEHGTNHLIGLRVQGAQRGYYAGFINENTVGIIKRIKGKDTIIKSCNYKWSFGNEYKLSFIAKGDNLTFSINGEQILSTVDTAIKYGMISYALHDKGRALFGNMKVKEL